MNDNILLVCDIYSIIPLCIYFVMIYLGAYTNNINEALGFIIFYFINNEIVSIIKKLPYPKLLWDITRRPEGAFNTDYLSRNGSANKDAPGFPSGHMTSITAFCLYMVLRKKGELGWEEFIIGNPIFLGINILSIMAMGFARWYKSCHNMLQIVCGIIFGAITSYIYYELIGKSLIN